MRIYDSSGILFTEASFTKDLGYYTNSKPLPVTSLHQYSWNVAPGPITCSTALTAGAVVASGQRANMLISPPYPSIMTGLAIRITTATNGIPLQSGIFGLYTNVTVRNSKYMSLFPHQKIWQSNPFFCGATGVYATGISVYLEPNSIYWLTLTTTRNATMHNLQVNQPDYHGRISAPGNNATVGYSVAISPVTMWLDNYYNTSATAQTSVQPCIFYSLARV